METRPYKESDLNDVAAIELASFPHPYTKDEIKKYLKNPAHICYVIEEEGRVIGFVIYAKVANSLSIWSLAVEAMWRRQGAGTMLVKRLKYLERRVGCTVRERNVVAQKFFRSLGIPWVATVRGMYPETEEDAYCFESDPEACCQSQ